MHLQSWQSVLPKRSQVQLIIVTLHHSLNLILETIFSKESLNSTLAYNKQHVTNCSVCYSMNQTQERRGECLVHSIEAQCVLNDNLTPEGSQGSANDSNHSILSFYFRREVGMQPRIINNVSLTVLCFISSNRPNIFKKEAQQQTKHFQKGSSAQYIARYWSYKHSIAVTYYREMNIILSCHFLTSISSYHSYDKRCTERDHLV